MDGRVIKPREIQHTKPNNSSVRYVRIIENKGEKIGGLKPMYPRERWVLFSGIAANDTLMH